MSIKERELEVQLWTDRLTLVQSQSQLLQYQARECQQNLVAAKEAHAKAMRDEEAKNAKPQEAPAEAPGTAPG